MAVTGRRDGAAGGVLATRTATDLALPPGVLPEHPNRQMALQLKIKKVIYVGTIKK